MYKQFFTQISIVIQTHDFSLKDNVRIFIHRKLIVQKKRQKQMYFCTRHAIFEKNNMALTFEIMIDTCSFCTQQNHKRKIVLMMSARWPILVIYANIVFNERQLNILKSIKLSILMRIIDFFESD